MFFRFALCALFFLSSHLFAVELSTLSDAIKQEGIAGLHSRVNVQISQGSSDDEDVMIFCHGMYGTGADVHHLKQHDIIPHHLISFNFPDHGTAINEKKAEQLHFGSLDELLPLLILMKECVINGGVQSLSLYGFSAGGGACVNALAVLANGRYEKRLSAVGINTKRKKEILAAMEKGYLILDCPLKSVEEIIADRGSSHGIEVLKENYSKNKLRPIDSVTALKPLSLNIIIHFQVPDKTLTNRDDTLYLKRVQRANHKGKTTVILGNEGEHSLFLPSLQTELTSLLANNKE